MPSPVSILFEEHSSILEHLRTTEPSFHASLEITLPKALLLAAASEYEARACQQLLQFIKTNSSDAKIAVLVDKKIVRRNYHTWFEWEKSNVNNFWAFFGDEFKEKMKRAVQDDTELSDSIKAFLEIGRLRNQLVHNDYASFTLEKTLEEIHLLYIRGNMFIDSLSKILDETY